MPVYNEQGTYRATIALAELGTARTGTHQLVLHLTPHAILDSTNTEQPVRPTRYPPRVYISITEKTIGTADSPGWAAQALTQLGFRGNFDDIARLAGWTGYFYCEHQPSRDDPQDLRESWSVITHAAQPTAQPADKKTTRQLNAQFADVFKSMGRTATPPQQPQQQPAQPTHQPADTNLIDEIPF